MREQLVADLSRDYGVHPYGKWRGAFWRLAALVELGVVRSSETDRDVESVLGWLANPRRLRSFPELEGRVRRCASQDGLALYVICRLGVDDDRLDVLADSLVRASGPTEAGTATDVPPRGIRPSTRRGARSSVSRRTPGRRVTILRREAAEAAADFILDHNVYQSHRTGEPAHPAVLNLRFPPYWHYDVLVGLVTLARSVGLGDSRTAAALDLVESRRRPDGTWRTEGKWWKRPGSKGSNVEAVDWGETADELLTERAHEVLEAGGRK